MQEVLEKISKLGIVPVVVLQDAKDAVALAKALKDGGLPCAEVTFRTSAAEESIRLMTEAYPDMLIGAGTVLTIEQARRAAAAGAKFIVSPGFNLQVVTYCLEQGITIVPGCSSPTDIEQALEQGLLVVKFFPAEASGGLAMIKAMAAPYKNIKFMPTGGITEKNLKEYLSFSQVAACGGSWMVKDEYIKEGRFEEITKLTKRAVEQMLGFSLGHVGINCQNRQEASEAAAEFYQLFGFETRDGNNSVFAGSFVEAMKSPYLGKNGHIAIRTDSISRAVAYLQARGCKFRADSIKLKDGCMTAIYLEQEIGGFAIHLVQK